MKMTFTKHQFIIISICIIGFVFIFLYSIFDKNYPFLESIKMIESSKIFLDENDTRKHWPTMEQ